MSNQKNEDQMSSVTTTTEEVTETTETSLDGLTATEEKVIRMLHGLSEDDSRALDFGLGADEESKLKMALIERQLADAMSAPERSPDDGRQTPAELLSSFLDEE